MIKSSAWNNLLTAGGQFFSSLNNFLFSPSSHFFSISLFVTAHNLSLPWGGEQALIARGIGVPCLPITHTHTPLYPDFLLSHPLHTYIAHLPVSPHPFALLAPLKSAQDLEKAKKKKSQPSGSSSPCGGNTRFLLKHSWRKQKKCVL